MRRMSSAPRMRGQCRIQLFDDRGRTVRDVKKHNAISARYLQAIEASVQALLCMSSHTSPIGTGMVPNLSQAANQVPFSGLYLTDTDAPVDPKDRFVRGNVLGYSTMYGTAVGDLGGTYNATESIRTPLFHRHVYDFATNQANGTIKSIYTAPVIDQGAVYPQKVSSVLLSGAAAGSGFYQARLAAVSANGVVIVANNNNGTMGVAASAADMIAGLYDTVVPPYMLYGLAAKDGRFYWIRIDGNDHVIESVPDNDLEDIREEKRLDATWKSTIAGWTTSQNGTRLWGLGWDGTRQRWLISSRDSNPSSSSYPSHHFYEFDDTFADTQQYILPFGTAISSDTLVAFTIAPESSEIYLESGELWQLDPLNGDGTLISKIAIKNHPTYSNRSGLRLIADSIGPHCSYPSSVSSSQFAVAQQFFSRVLLDDPITKTAANTMKITYEFTVTPPDFGALWP